MGKADGATGRHVPGVRNLHRAAPERPPEAVVQGSPDRRRTDVKGEDQWPISAIRADGAGFDHTTLMRLSVLTGLVRPVRPLLGWCHVR